VDGKRHTVLGADDVPIGLLTAGQGSCLLLVHGGMTQLEAWAPAWDLLCSRWRVTAIDRRGRGSSGDASSYAIKDEYDDIAAVAWTLADEQGGPVDVVGHSFGATCVLGAAARGAAFRRVVLYEPPARQTVSPDWVARASGMATRGQAGRAMFSFLTEIMGLTPSQVTDLAARPSSYDVLAIVAKTLPLEAAALLATDLTRTARAVNNPVLLMLGETSPAWAREITHDLATALAIAEIAHLPGQGHEAIDAAPHLIVAALERFLRAGEPRINTATRR
jgi:pimeloyl-ACP methyl ester carboxylesterase